MIRLCGLARPGGGNIELKECRVCYNTQNKPLFRPHFLGIGIARLAIDSWHLLMLKIHLFGYKWWIPNQSVVSQLQTLTKTQLPNKILWIPSLTPPAAASCWPP